MKRMPESGFGRTSWWLASLFALALLACSCSNNTRTECVAAAMVDTAGEVSESARLDFQWLAIRVGLDSALRTGDGIKAHRASRIRLDSAIDRYRDSTRLDGKRLLSRSGCIDWRATWLEGRFDRLALATAMVGLLVSGGPNVAEWTLTDSAAPTVKLHAVIALPGTDGGTIDSVVLAISPSEVAIER